MIEGITGMDIGVDMRVVSRVEIDKGLGGVGEEGERLGEVEEEGMRGILRGIGRRRGMERGRDTRLGREEMWSSEMTRWVPFSFVPLYLHSSLCFSYGSGVCIRHLRSLLTFIKQDPDRPPSVEPEKPNFGNSGLLAKEANTVTVKGNSVQLKYHEPPEARKPLKNWRLYVFKGKEQLGECTLHRTGQSCC